MQFAATESTIPFDFPPAKLENAHFNVSAFRGNFSPRSVFKTQLESTTVLYSCGIFWNRFFYFIFLWNKQNSFISLMSSGHYLHMFNILPLYWRKKQSGIPAFKRDLPWHQLKPQSSLRVWEAHPKVAHELDRRYILSSITALRVLPLSLGRGVWLDCDNFLTTLMQYKSQC